MEHEFWSYSDSLPLGSLLAAIEHRFGRYMTLEVNVTRRFVAWNSRIMGRDIRLVEDQYYRVCCYMGAIDSKLVC